MLKTRTTKIDVNTGNTTVSETAIGYDDLKSLVGIPKLIVLLFSSFFGFKKFYLWDIAVMSHLLIQMIVFIGIMSLETYEITNMRFNFLGTNSKLVIWLMSFIAIRIIFELLLIILGIHNQLSTIAESLEKFEKNMK